MFFLFFFSLPLSAAQLLSYPGKNKIPLNYHIVEVNTFLTIHVLKIQLISNQSLVWNIYQQFFFFF